MFRLQYLEIPMRTLSSHLCTSSRTLAFATRAFAIWGVSCAIASCAIVPHTVLAAEVAANNKTSESLKREILAMDARLNEAYADCHTRRIRDLFAHDAELIFAERGRLHGVAAHVDELRRGGCTMRRETAAPAQLIEALPDHTGAIDGAIQAGEQIFCAQDAQPCRGVATRFVAIWHRTDQGWKISRLIRYGYASTP
jgi:Domain of unknown function (DUF4440)